MLRRPVSIASGSAKVVTNDDMFSIGLVSVHSSLATSALAARAEIPCRGNSFSGTAMLNSSYIVTFSADAPNSFANLSINAPFDFCYIVLTI